MSGDVADVAAPRAARATQRYGTLVIVGGGCYGSYYVRQLRRAASAGALSFRRLLVVDRDPACRVAADLAVGGGEPGAPPDGHDTSARPSDHHRSPAPEVVVAQWSEFFDRYLGGAADDPDAFAAD